MEVPVTEDSHPLTCNLDISAPINIVHQIEDCERELFSGWKESQGLYNRHILDVLQKLVDITADLLQSPEDSLIVLSGCGTSGRLGFITARSFNNFMKKSDASFPSVFNYLIAGGDLAFFTSQERAEDKPELGVDDLQKACEGKKRVLLIAITCGFSAPYVAGQLDYALDHLDVFTPVLLGFNPVHLSRNIPIENWDKTFLEVARRLDAAQENQRCFILNPIIGPEPLTGSTRMKGGSATKILLDCVFHAAYSKIRNNPCDIKSLLGVYELVQGVTYSHKAEIAQLIQRAGTSLNRHGHVYYLSDAHLGMFGLLDASECPPTFGAGFEDVRGFLIGGYTELDNKEGDISDKVPISMEYFVRERMPSLTANDLVIFLKAGDGPSPPDQLLDSKAVKVLIHFTSPQQETLETSEKFDQVLRICLPWSDISGRLGDALTADMWPHLVEMSCKWLLNAVSTGGHVLRGKVYQNYMVDLNVSNFKLYHRAIGIIQGFSKLSQKESEEMLLKSIYQRDRLPPGVRAAAVGDHIQAASKRQKVVPVALVLGATSLTVLKALALVEHCAIVRVAVSKCIHGNEALM